MGSLQTLIMMGVIFFAKITIFRIYIQYLYFMFCCILVSNTQSDNYRLYPYELFQDHIHFSFATHKKERVHINIIDIMNVVFYAASILKLGICSGCKHSCCVIMPFFLKPENKFNSHFFLAEELTS